MGEPGRLAAPALRTPLRVRCTVCWHCTALAGAGRERGGGASSSPHCWAGMLGAGTLARQQPLTALHAWCACVQASVSMRPLTAAGPGSRLPRPVPQRQAPGMQAQSSMQPPGQQPPQSWQSRGQQAAQVMAQAPTSLQQPQLAVDRRRSSDRAAEPLQSQRHHHVQQPQQHLQHPQHPPQPGGPPTGRRESLLSDDVGAAPARGAGDAGSLRHASARPGAAAAGPEAAAGVRSKFAAAVGAGSSAYSVRPPWAVYERVAVPPSAQQARQLL
jgi:hypothetical protein